MDAFELAEEVIQDSMHGHDEQQDDEKPEQPGDRSAMPQRKNKPENL